MILLFYMFSLFLLGSAVSVIVNRNPVYAVLSLVLCFLNAAGLFLLLGAEFVATILIVVYVGAVAVLFLFVVMMLDVHFETTRAAIARYRIPIIVLGAILAAELILVLVYWPTSTIRGELSPTALSAFKTNTHRIGEILYTTHAVPFQIAGLILLVAMIGAIVLTLRPRTEVRRQDVRSQIQTSAQDRLQMKDVPANQGVKV